MSRPVWAADIDVDASLAGRLIAAQFPALGAAAIESLGVGWDNAAFLAGERIVFRFPRRRVAVRLIGREIVLLPLIAAQLPLAISAPSYIGSAGAAYPWPFAGYELIAGTTACGVALSDEQRCALAEPLALFLRALHGIPTAPLVAAGLPADEIGRLDHAKRMRLVRERLPTLIDAGYARELDAPVSWLETHAPVPIEPEQRTLVHGDLYARHVVVDARIRPVGVIDWGDVHLGDPALDLAIAHLMLPAEAHSRFRDAYGPIDDRTWDAARYRALYHAILELDYGIREDDAGMREIGMAALRLNYR